MKFKKVIKAMLKNPTISKVFLIIHKGTGLMKFL